MQQAIRTPRSVIVGLGRTGVSAARHLAARGHRLVVTDSRANPPGLAELRRLVPRGGDRARRLRPGGARGRGPDRRVARRLARGALPAQGGARGLDLVGDIELFAREAGGRVVGITGTNGKSTVTTLVGEFAQAAGSRCASAATSASPRSTCSRARRPRCTCSSSPRTSSRPRWSLQPEAAAVLNVTPDHLDRYRDLAEYAAAKARIFERAATAS